MHCVLTHRLFVAAFLVIGSFATDQAVELLAQADCVLAIGISLNIYQTGGGSIAPQGPLIQIETARELGAEFR